MSASLNYARAGLVLVMLTSMSCSGGGKTPAEKLGALEESHLVVPGAEIVRPLTLYERDWANPGARTDLRFVTAKASDEVFAFYKAEMERRGWEEAREFALEPWITRGASWTKGSVAVSLAQYGSLTQADRTPLGPNVNAFSIEAKEFLE